MAPNANNELLKKLRDVIEKGGGIDVNTRDVLLFSAIVDMYDQNEKLSAEINALKENNQAEIQKLRDETRPMMTFYRVALWAGMVLGVSFIGLMFGMLTGQVEVYFK